MISIVLNLLKCASGAGKEFACNAGDTGDSGLIPGSGRSPGRGNGNPLQYFCLKNPMEPGGLVSPECRKELDMTSQLSLSLSFEVSFGNYGSLCHGYSLVIM